MEKKKRKNEKTPPPAGVNVIRRPGNIIIFIWPPIMRAADFRRLIFAPVSRHPFNSMFRRNDKLKVCPHEPTLRRPILGRFYTVIDFEPVNRYNVIIA